MPAQNGSPIGATQLDMARCPHCAVATPLLNQVWSSKGATPRNDGGPATIWAAYVCSRCGSLIAAMGEPAWISPQAPIVEIFPDYKEVSFDLPDRVRTYLQQAYSSLHAPDAAAMVAGSAVDAMLKHFGYKEGSVYVRIDQARKDGRLTEGMAEWAHQVRLGSNRPRHADEDDPHVTADEAKQSVDFADALGTFLFVLDARIKRGLKATGAPES